MEGNFVARLDRFWRLIQNIAALSDARKINFSAPQPEVQMLAIRGSALFDADWYIENNADVAAAGIDPLFHYVRHGGFEGRDPSPNFSSFDYLSEHPNLVATRTNPLYHYIASGEAKEKHPNSSSTVIRKSEQSLGLELSTLPEIIQRIFPVSLDTCLPFGEAARVGPSTVIFSVTIAQNIDCFISLHVGASNGSSSKSIVIALSQGGSEGFRPIASSLKGNRVRPLEGSPGCFEIEVSSAQICVLVPTEFRSSSQLNLFLVPTSSDGEVIVRPNLVARAAPIESTKVNGRSAVRTLPRAIDMQWIEQLPKDILSRLAVDILTSMSVALRELHSRSAEWSAENNDPVAFNEFIRETYRRFGLQQAGAQIFLNISRPNAQSAAFELLADYVCSRDLNAAWALYWISYATYPNEKKARKLAAKMFKAGSVIWAARLLTMSSSAEDTAFIAELRLASSLQAGIRIPERIRYSPPLQDRIAYVAAGTLPHLHSGYAIRTHQLLRALKSEGVQVDCYVRPGFPFDRPDIQAQLDISSLISEVDGIEYKYSTTEPITYEPEQFLNRAANVLEESFRTTLPSIVHAASNHRNALPALIAARRLGIPFIYEVRGLWELTAASRVRGWEDTERFQLERKLEILIANEADRVLTITQGVADELISGGVDAAKISLLPNAVDPKQFSSATRDEGLATKLGITTDMFTIVYCGSLTAYEGLDDLIAAIALIRQRGVDARVLVVGEGPAQKALEAAVNRHNLESYVSFIGRVPPDETRAFLSLADAVALPRKNHKVCRVVSPLKPFEAMAMGKPIVLSDLPVMHEIVDDGRTGRFCQAEDSVSLANVLYELAQNPTDRQRIGLAGKEWVLQNRTWKQNAARLISIYQALSAFRACEQQSA